MSFLITNKNLNAIIILLITFVFVGMAYQAEAQRYSPNGRHVKRGGKTNIGLEVSLGTQTLKLNSNISALNNMSAPLEGWSAGVVMGNKFYRGKIKQGFYKAAPAATETFQLSETKGVLNIYVLSLLNSRSKYFKPYLITAVNHGLVKFYGSYIDVSQTGSSSSSINGNTSDKNYLGKISTVNANLGLGFECQIPSEKHFATFFTEAQYGVPLSTTNRDAAFSKTKVSNVVSINFGLSFGISR